MATSPTYPSTRSTRSANTDGRSRGSATPLHPRLGRLEQTQGKDEEAHQGYSARPHQALCPAPSRAWLRLLCRQLYAARAGGLVPLRGYTRPTEIDPTGEARHGKPTPDGPPGLWRCGIWQDGGGYTRRLQSRLRQQAGSRAGADHRTGLSAFQDVLQTTAGHAGTRGLPVACTHDQTDATGDGGLGGRQDRHSCRHPQAHRQVGEMERPRTADHRRRTEVWRGDEREAPPTEDQCRYAHPIGHPPSPGHYSSRSWGRGT